jgi:hypothetical protein
MTPRKPLNEGQNLKIPLADDLQRGQHLKMPTQPAQAAVQPTQPQTGGTANDRK